MNVKTAKIVCNSFYSPSEALSNKSSPRGHEENSNSNGYLSDHVIKSTSSLPPVELLCPFEDVEKGERHLMNNAVIAPCCGYFICCEDCKYIFNLKLVMEQPDCVPKKNYE